MKSIAAILFFSITFLDCQPTKIPTHVSLDYIDIEKISEHTFIHTSYLIIPKFGKFGCNGLVYVNGGEAIIFDTPIDPIASKQLYKWIEKTLKAKVIGVVVNHFHVDCLGGLAYFHKKNIPSYSNQLTKTLAEADSVVAPIYVFNEKTEIAVGQSNIECRFFGEGHTRDNIVSWLPEEKILFGGCMVKSLKAGKGNLRDADLREWSNTIEKVKQQYADVKIVVPGHGKHGGIELLDYTIEMFRN